MAKRFITTDIFDDAWFMDLPAKYKLFWLYLITKCDHSGIWQVNYKLAQFYVGEHLEPTECERMFKERIKILENGKYWFIEKFLLFQYGPVIKSNNPALKKVIEKIDFFDLENKLLKVRIKRDNSKGASKGLQRGSKALEEKEKEKEKEKEEVKKEIKVKDKNKDKIDFDIFWNLYDKKVNKVKTKIKWDRLSKETQQKVLDHIPKYIKSTPDKKFRKNPDTYLNNQSWNDEIIVTNNISKHKIKTGDFSDESLAKGKYGNIGQ